MEQVFDRLIMFIKQIAAGHELFSPDLAVFLVCLHEFNISMFHELRNNPNPITRPLLSEISGRFSYSKEVFGDKYFKKFYPFDRNIAPVLLEICTFSYFSKNQNVDDKIFIMDNIDRFFILKHKIGFVNNMPLIHKTYLHLKQILILRNSRQLF